MQNKRYNVFNQIHKALRAMLYDTATNIQRTDFCSDEAVATIDQLEQLLNLFDEHADHEDHYILPHVQKHDARLVETLEQDHVVDHRLTESLQNSIAEWRRSSGAEQRFQIGQQIFYAFNEFIAFNLYHMNKEENELICVLWKHYSDLEILGMEQQILQNIAPETLQIESMWMMKSISTPEIIGWLGGVAAHAPAEVFAGLMQLAEGVLPAVRFQQVAKAFAQEEVMA
jgi:hemerythrin-like domain-containing protein